MCIYIYIHIINMQSRNLIYAWILHDNDSQLHYLEEAPKFGLASRSPAHCCCEPFTQ